MLKPHEADLIMQLYGLDGQFHTSGELCKKFKLNPAQLQYEEDKILKKIRFSGYAKQLKALF